MRSTSNLPPLGAESVSSKPVPSKKSILESKVRWEEQRLEQEQFRKMMAEKLKRDQTLRSNDVLGKPHKKIIRRRIHK